MNNLVALAIGGAPGTARAASAATKELAPTSKPARAGLGSVNQ